MKKIMLYAALVSSVMTGCERSAEPPSVQNKPVNYIVLLDLSDRLLLKNQSQNDISLIETAFADFARTVREKNLIIYSKDKFRIVIARQKNIKYDPAFFMNALYLDMNAIPLEKRRDSLESFEQGLDRKLQELYRTALTDKSRNEDFMGCDLWSYFNLNLETDLDPAARNMLIIMTDGYFDFENNPYVKSYGNRSTSTGFIAKLRQRPNPVEEFNLGDYGLVRINKSLPEDLSIGVFEISPKSDLLDESELLQCIWRKWTFEMGITKSIFVLKESLPKSQGQLLGFVESKQP